MVSQLKSDLENRMGLTATEAAFLSGEIKLIIKNVYDNLFGNQQPYDLFRLRLHYDELPSNADDLAAPGRSLEAQYNGNIAAMGWQIPNYCGVKGYGFSYDGINRLTEAWYGEQLNTDGNWTHNNTHYNADFTYDKNGNITDLNRNGLIGAGNLYGQMDAMSYVYEGNQLIRVSDSKSSAVAGVDEFTDGASQTIEYQYDLNGNMTLDKNKQINIPITYNFMNKPTAILMPTGSLNYLYSADGTKLRQKVGPTNTVVNDYVGPFHYTKTTSDPQPQVEFIQSTKGRLVWDGNKYRYEYFLKDHLGNTRVVFGDYDDDGRINPDPLAGNDVKQVVAGYYPFGMRHGTEQNATSPPSNSYLYNGKELQEDIGLKWYDYGARMYDPSVGRWNAVDALAESQNSYTPYHYTYNNPVLFIDPTGLMPKYNWSTGKYENENGNVVSWDEAKENIDKGGNYSTKLTRDKDKKDSWNASFFVDHKIEIRGKHVATVTNEIIMHKS
ncbi:MAG: RHS repeat-associated core domain-containing protein, partial [Bacteroidota bacterium]